MSRLLISRSPTPPSPALSHSPLPNFRLIVSRNRLSGSGKEFMSTIAPRSNGPLRPSSTGLQSSVEADPVLQYIQRQIVELENVEVYLEDPKSKALSEAARNIGAAYLQA